jgi:hypothetical protein
MLYNLMFMLADSSIIPFRATKLQQSLRLLADHNTTNIYSLLAVSFTEPRGLKEYSFFEKRRFVSPAYLQNDAFFKTELEKNGDRKIVFLFDCMEFLSDLEWPFKFFFGEKSYVDFLAFNVTNTDSYGFRKHPETAYRLAPPVTRQILEPPALEEICRKYSLTITENIFLGRRDESELGTPEEERSLLVQLRKQLIGRTGTEKSYYEDRLFMVHRSKGAIRA